MNIAHSLQAWATSLGMERRTLESRLVQAGYHPPEKKGGKIPAKRVYVTLMGDERAEKIRNLKADADRKEREEAEAAGELVRMGDVERLLVELVVIPLRQALLSAPTMLDTRCNPGDPELARAAVQGWVDDTLKLLREKLTDQK